MATFIQLIYTFYIRRISHVRIACLPAHKIANDDERQLESCADQIEHGESDDEHVERGLEVLVAVEHPE